MRIRFEMSGGIAFFPALAGPITIDTSALPSTTASRLEELVADAQFFSRSPQQVTHGGADAQHYVLSVEDGDNTRTLEFRDPVVDPAIHDLVALVRSLSTH